MEKKYIQSIALWFGVLFVVGGLVWYSLFYTNPGDVIRDAIVMVSTVLIIASILFMVYLVTKS